MTHMVHERARVHRKDDEDIVGQVERKHGGKSSWWSMRKDCKRFEGVKDRQEASISGWFDWFGRKTGGVSCFEERPRLFGGLSLSNSL